MPTNIISSIETANDFFKKCPWSMETCLDSYQIISSPQKKECKELTELCDTLVNKMS